MLLKPPHPLIIRAILLFFSMAWFLFSFAIPGFGASTVSNDFPVYPAIINNVQFWEKIYAVYSLKQAVIHDSEDLSKVYKVIALADPEAPGARQLNTVLQKKACDHYRLILQNLAKRAPNSAEEQRVAALFRGKNGRQDMARATANVRSQSGQKERFLRGVAISQAYSAEIKNILRSHGLPEELAHLPHVESSFNFKAYSRLGAAGLWQFTRETGKQYLTIDSNIDERLDPITSTHAAAKYLAKSYSSLNNWPLAITSYNYGLGGTLRAVAEQGSYERIFANYNKGYFKFASRNFYSEFLAARNVATYLEKNQSGNRHPQSKFRYLQLPGYAGIDDLSRHFGVPVGEIAELNPALRPPVTSGQKLIPKGYSLRLPAGGTTEKRIAALSPSILKDGQNANRYHLVKKGDTAHSIAKLHKVSLKSLIQVNNLDRLATVRLGQNLIIPTKAGTAAASSSKTTGSSTRVSVPKNVTTKNSPQPKEV